MSPLGRDGQHLGGQVFGFRRVGCAHAGHEADIDAGGVQVAEGTELARNTHGGRNRYGNQLIAIGEHPLSGWWTGAGPPVSVAYFNYGLYSPKRLGATRRSPHGPYP
jgi:hypothetical protein